MLPPVGLESETKKRWLTNRIFKLKISVEKKSDYRKELLDLSSISFGLGAVAACPQLFCVNTHATDSLSKSVQGQYHHPKPLFHLFPNALIKGLCRQQTLSIQSNQVRLLCSIQVNRKLLRKLNVSALVHFWQAFDNYKGRTQQKNINLHLESGSSFYIFSKLLWRAAARVKLDIIVTWTPDAVFSSLDNAVWSRHWIRDEKTVLTRDLNGAHSWA